MEENKDGQFTLLGVEECNRNTKKVPIVILCIFALILLVFTIQNCIKIISGYKIYKQYEAQLNALEYQKQQKAIEEAKKQEKMPKLTEIRKK